MITSSNEKYGISLLFLLSGFLLFFAPTFAAEIEMETVCQSDISSTLKTLCSSDDISSLDKQLSNLYAQSLSSLPNNSTTAVAQRAWIKETISQCEDHECLGNAYRRRIVILMHAVEQPSHEIQSASLNASDLNTAVGAKIENRKVNEVFTFERPEELATPQVSKPQSQVVAQPNDVSAHPTPADNSLHPWQIFVLVWLVVVIIGIIMGCTDTITVFRNYNDLALVFFIGFSMVAGVYVLFLLSGDGVKVFSSILVGIAGLTATVLFLTIVVRTWQDNPSIIRFPFAFITKITLAALFLVNLVDLISPSGKTQSQRAKSKRGALLFLVFLTPMIYRLVRDKEGVWAPKNVLNQYQRGKLRL